MCFWTPDDFDDENVEAWALALYKTDGCLDALPFQFYRTTTIPKIWVGLDLKFIYLSMGSLAEEVWAKATSLWLPTYAVPKMKVDHGWEATLTGEVPILGRVIKRLGLIIRILSMVNSGLFLMDVSNIVVKVYHLCRVSNYSNSCVHGYGQLGWPYCSNVRCFQNDLWNELWFWLDHNRVVKVKAKFPLRCFQTYFTFLCFWTQLRFQTQLHK